MRIEITDVNIVLVRWGYLDKEGTVMRRKYKNKYWAGRSWGQLVNSHVAQLYKGAWQFCLMKKLHWIGLIRIPFLCSLNNKCPNEVLRETLELIPPLSL